MSAVKGESVTVVASDPLNFAGIITPDERVASNMLRRIVVYPAAS